MWVQILPRSPSLPEASATPPAQHRGALAEKNANDCLSARILIQLETLKNSDIASTKANGMRTYGLGDLADEDDMSEMYLGLLTWNRRCMLEIILQ